MLDVLIQTFNEELNLPHTLASLRAGREAGWIRSVQVVDSGSTDATVRLAEEADANVVERPWLGYARQKNWALANMPLEAPWTLILDADEAISPELSEELRVLVSRPPDEVAESGFQVNRVFIFNGKRIWHCGYFPSWNLRLFKRGQARYEERLVHEHMKCDGPVGHLKELLIHEDRRGLEHFFAKHNRYSTLEAREVFKNPEPWPGVQGFLSDTTRRRRFLKSRVLPRMPLPWLSRFTYMYFLRLGILDGRAGLELCSFISTYESLIRAKYREVRRISARQGRETSLSGGAADDAVVTITGVKGLAKAEGLVSAETSQPVAEVVTPRLPSIPGKVPAPKTPKVAGGDAASSEGVVVYDGAARQDDAGERSKPFGGDRAGKASVSIVIPTLNEATNLARCLDHLTWADEVVVVDSGSEDATIDIAKQYGAKAIDFRWDGRWPKKKNWALQHAQLANDWVLIVDADEWITPELAAEISRVVADPQENVGYYINRRFIFMGRWIRHCGYYPSWNLRLIRRGRGEYEKLVDTGNTGSGDNEVHEHVVPQGPVAYLNHDMLHFAFPNIHTFMEKHNRYSNWEAIVQRQQGENNVGEIGSVLGRRRRLKNLSRNVPFRPTLRFLYSYVWRGGFLDGKAGYIFCRLLAIYEYLSVAKHTELVRAEDDVQKARSLSKVPSALP